MATSAIAKGRIFLDQVDEDRFQLTDVVLQQRVALPAGEYSVVDDDGDDVILAAVYPDGDTAAVDAESFFKLTLFTSNTTAELFTIDETVGSSSLRSFWDFQAKHRSGSVEVNVLGGASFPFDCFVFQMPRAGKQRLYWSMHSIYDFIKIDSFKNTPSKWAFRCCERWERRFPIDGGGQIVYGNYVSSHTAKRLQLAFPAKCLQVTSVSTFGLLFQMAKWAWSPAHYGGFDMKREASCEQVKAAQSFLNSVAQTVKVYGRCWNFSVFLESKWTCKWPRPQPGYLDECMDFRVDDKMEIDLQAFCTRAQIAWNDTFIHRLWGMCLAGRCSQANFYRMPMLDMIMLSAAQASPVAESMLAQLCLALSHQLQLVMASDNNDGHHIKRDVEFNFDDPSEGFGVGEDVDHALAKYVTNAAQQIGNPRCVSIATDKASVGNLPLQVTVLALPSNLAVLMPPQVAAGHPELPPGRPVARYRCIKNGPSCVRFIHHPPSWPWGFAQ